MFIQARGFNSSPNKKLQAHKGVLQCHTVEPVGAQRPERTLKGLIVGIF
jgi:hypothetical protein